MENIKKNQIVGWFETGSKNHYPIKCKVLNISKYQPFEISGVRMQVLEAGIDTTKRPGMNCETGKLENIYEWEEAVKLHNKLTGEKTIIKDINGNINKY